MDATPQQAIEMLKELQRKCYGVDDKGNLFRYGGCIFNCSIDLAVSALDDMDSQEG